MVGNGISKFVMDDQKSEEVGRDAQSEKQSAAPAPGIHPGKIATLLTANNLIEDYCAVGDPMIMEWKGKRYPTRMRGAKSETITTNITGKKSRQEILLGTSYLIVEATKQFASAGFEYNTPITMRFLYGGSVYAFKTSIMQIHPRPSLVVLEYPDQEQRYNMRSNERVPVVAPALIAVTDGAESRNGAVVNLSPTGALVGLDAADGLGVGRKLVISFTLPSGDEVSRLAAVVRNMYEENGKHLLGTNFEKPYPAVDDFCRKFSDLAEGVHWAGTDATLGLGKSALIEFAHKSGQVIVRGWKAGENGYILTDKPQGTLPPLQQGQEAVIREENKGIIFSMAVKYEGLLKKANLCHFSLRTDLITRPLRVAERFHCLIPGTLNYSDSRSDQSVAGAIINLGHGGFRIVTRKSLYSEIGDILSASFHLGGIGFISGQKIRMMRATRHGNRYEYAAQFMEVNDANAKLLDSYLSFYKAWAGLEQR